MFLIAAAIGWAWTWKPKKKRFLVTRVMKVFPESSNPREEKMKHEKQILISNQLRHDPIKYEKIFPSLGEAIKWAQEQEEGTFFVEKI